ncbi:MAG: rod shape-determining protein RodA [Culturomica sp.]|jgi:rod shape determining protein RodA|nr:rod shape-determining protein RodA [Culturomica sp.]
MERQTKLIRNLDWFTIILYIVMVFLGWLNIYAAVYDENHNSIFDISQRYGKQMIWILFAFILGIVIILTDSKFFTTFSFVIYGIVMASLIAVIYAGLEVNGSRSWIRIAGFQIQPTEFSKFATALAVANLMSRHNFRIMRFKSVLQLGLIVGIPILLILLQNDTGSALVFCSFLLVFYREGMHGSILLLFFCTVLLFIFTLLYSPMTVLLMIILGTLGSFLYYRHSRQELFTVILALSATFLFGIFLNWLFDLKKEYSNILLYSYAVICVVSIYFIYKNKMKHIIMLLLASWLCICSTITVDYVFDRLQPHQQKRINNLLGIDSDITGAGYNVHQSKIAIGSGGFSGKGFLEGTQTKFNFVPEQSTDFIYCTIGEEWGFLGSTTVILLFVILMIRIIKLAERQRSAFSRIYGYCVAAIFFFHVAVNIGMTIGMAPVIGIPLPFFSYGGSSLWAFTILLFIFLRLDANRLQVFR